MIIRESKKQCEHRKFIISNDMYELGSIFQNKRKLMSFAVVKVSFLL